MGEVRLYDRLFAHPTPGARREGDPPELERNYMDGSIHIFYKDKELKNKLIPKKRTKLTEEELLTVKT